MGWFATLFMGFVLGMLGGGGGILTVPILVGLFGLPATEATGDSLFIVGLTSAVGAAIGIKKGQCAIGPALLLAVPSMVGALASRLFLVPSIPERVLALTKDQALLGAFAILMVIVGFRMLAKRTDEAKPKQSPILVSLFGLMIGLVSGTLGAGGGFLIVPVLTLLMGVGMDKAIPTSLLVISVQSLVGFLGEVRRPIDWPLLLPMSGIALAGMLAGLRFREHVPLQTLRAAFAILVLAVAAWMIVRIL
ncbi:MAG: sulfite exporter TauE/SafE family protein [Fimbriimonadaceae bacterium]|nr:sulfite exporter TauE/SafE family protein [Fimbriimonadaceae bacterium]QYK58330.1 MAG: sulfite exporter TauE/SafE family protein [Fimbriimonadaceae bacterium]